MTKITRGNLTYLQNENSEQCEKWKWFSTILLVSNLLWDCVIVTKVCIAGTDFPNIKYKIHIERTL